MSFMRGWLWVALLLAATNVGLAYDLPRNNRSGLKSSALKELQKISREIAIIAKHARKAIVYVSTSKTIEMPFGYSDPLEFFFGPNYRRRNQERPKRKQEGLGSGFFVDLKRGYILTNNHVVADADEISLKLANDEVYNGSVVGRDSNTDVAVIEIKDKNFNRRGLQSLVLGDSSKLVVGDLAFALGAPFGLEASLSFGIVSAVGRGNLNITRMGNFIQTDAAINPGNSGGPLLNDAGLVVGLNTAIYSRSGGYNGIGFAVPSNLVRRVAEQLINDGRVQRGYLGVQLQVISPDLHKSLRLPSDVKGALVSQVMRGEPADKAGFRAGDVIVAVNNRKIENVPELISIIGLIKPGVKAKVDIYRGARPKTIYVTIGAYRDEKQVRRSADSSGGGGIFGMTLSRVSDRLRKQYGFDSRQGLVVVDVASNSPASRSGLQRGDVLLSINGEKIKNTRSFRKQVNAASRPHIRIERQGQFLFVALRKK